MGIFWKIHFINPPEGQIRGEVVGFSTSKKETTTHKNTLNLMGSQGKNCAFALEMLRLEGKSQKLDFSQLSSLRHFHLKICAMRKHGKDHSNQLMGRRQQSLLRN